MTTQITRAAAAPTQSIPRCRGLRRIPAPHRRPAIQSDRGRLATPFSGCSGFRCPSDHRLSDLGPLGIRAGENAPLIAAAP